MLDSFDGVAVLRAKSVAGALHGLTVFSQIVHTHCAGDDAGTHTWTHAHVHTCAHTCKPTHPNACMHAHARSHACTADATVPAVHIRDSPAHRWRAVLLDSTADATSVTAAAPSARERGAAATTENARRWVDALAYTRPSAKNIQSMYPCACMYWAHPWQVQPNECAALAHTGSGAWRCRRSTEP